MLFYFWDVCGMMFLWWIVIEFFFFKVGGNLFFGNSIEKVMCVYIDVCLFDDDNIGDMSDEEEDIVGYLCFKFSF